MAITPTKEQFDAFAHHDRDGEVVMINLLHFSAPAAEGAGAAGAGAAGAEAASAEAASADEGGEHSSGSDAYRTYGDAAVQMVEERGGRVLWMGQPEQVLIGDTEADGWDMAVLVSYPNRAAFINMVTSPKYAEAHTHRERGLDRTVLLACRPLLDRLGDHA
jgi:uncharacterized protein (DUF1330 family)